MTAPGRILRVRRGLFVLQLGLLGLVVAMGWVVWQAETELAPIPARPVVAQTVSHAVDWRSLWEVPLQPRKSLVARKERKMSEPKKAPPAKKSPVRVAPIAAKLELVATSRHTDPERSMCIYLWRGDTRQRVARIGEEIRKTKYRLVEVGTDHVVLSNGNERVRVFLRGRKVSASKTRPTPGASTAIIQRRQWDGLTYRGRAAQGLEPGDVVLRVGQTEVHSYRALQARTSGKVIFALTIRRGERLLAMVIRQP